MSETADVRARMSPVKKDDNGLANWSARCDAISGHAVPEGSDGVGPSLAEWPRVPTRPGPTEVGAGGRCRRTAGTGGAGPGGRQPRAVGKTRWWDALPRPEWGGVRAPRRRQRLVRRSTGYNPDVLAIYEPGQFEEVVSYLILGDERALLFDTGPRDRRHARRWWQTLTDLPKWWC